MNLSDITEDKNIINFWEGLIQVAHLWDDVIDRDKEIPYRAVHEGFFFMLSELPENPFYNAYKPILQPVMTAAAINFIASVNMERNGERPDLSHVLRYSLGDVICTIALIVKGKGSVMRS